LGLKISTLEVFIVPILLIFILQVFCTVLFSTEIIFRALGKNYESAVMAGGVIGYGLSSLAVAAATVKTITLNHGPAPKALFLVSLAGTALVDLPNSLLIGILLQIPFFEFNLP